MININRKEECCGCNACGDICPKNAITYKIDNEGFWYPKIDKDKCIECGLCEQTCPILRGDTTRLNNYEEPKCYVAEHKSIDVIFSSTTGGMFTAFAEVMYRQKGYVGGAIHNKDFSVSEYISNKKEDLKFLRRSKDLQSYSEGFYKKVKSLLENGEKVFVCGVPCQIAALKLFLGKDYETLITADLICLGVNSPKVWRSYLDYIEQINNSKIIWTENKSKEYGWHKLTQKFVFENGNEYFDTSETSEFIKGFIKLHLYCRPSCYECKFKGFPRVADVSIGDFWGIEKRDPSYNSNMGTSVVMINSEKGFLYFDKVQKRINYKKVPLEWAVQGNPALTKSVAKPTCSRKEFFDDLDKTPFDKAIRKMKVKEKKTLRSVLRKAKPTLSFFYHIVCVTRLHPLALWQTFKYSGINNIFHNKGIICGKNSVINIDKSSKVQFDGIFIFGQNAKFPGSKQESRLYVGKNATLHILGDFTLKPDCDIEVLDGAELIIHGKKLINSDGNEGLTIVCGEKIEIGPDVGIGRDVCIRDTNGNHYINTIGYRTTRPVVVGEKAWLCESCTIMPGVKIGYGAIVGVNSTVTKSVPDRAMVSGFPAVVIQENVLWKR